jgi:hypothetical protein
MLGSKDSFVLPAIEFIPNAARLRIEAVGVKVV